MTDPDSVVDTVREWCRVRDVDPAEAAVARVAGSPEIDASPAAVADALGHLADGRATGVTDDAPGDTAKGDPFDRDDGGYIDDPDWRGDRDAVRDHYRRAGEAFDALAELGDEYPCLGHAAKSGWYSNRPVTDPDVIDAGWQTRTRPLTLSRDWGQIQRDLGTDGDERTVYQITSWDDPAAVTDTTLSRETDDGREYRTGSPTPEYADLRGFGFWVDFDLRDELKPQRGNLPDRTRATVERAARAMIDEVAELYGVETDAVYALDSGGGMYVYGPPEAALPVARLFEDDRARDRVMSELRDRLTEWSRNMWSRVCDRVDGADRVADPDFVQNVNRKSKAPLALHGDHDLVCVPLRDRDPETGAVRGSVDYAPTLPSAVDDDVIDASAAWARGLTDTRHTDSVSDLVATLWPSLSAECDSWATTLQTWLRGETHVEGRRAHATDAADADADRRAARRADRAGGASDELADAPVTPNRREVFDAVDALDAERVAEATVVAQWTEAASGLTDRSGDGKRAFVPVWGRNADSGNANYVHTGRGGWWVDTGDGTGGGPVKMALVAAGEISHTDDPDPELRGVGREWLRDHGFAVPAYTPDAETTDPDTGEPYGRMPLWSLREAAVTLDVCDRDAFVSRDAETGGVVDDPSDHDGDTYLGFPEGATYNAALEACREVGLVPGREQWAADDERPTPGGDHDDPTEVDVAFDHETAWAAADAVAPDDLGDAPSDHDGVQQSRDGDAWVCAHSGVRCDVVRAAAVATGLVPHAGVGLDADDYTRAYEWARSEWDAPLPEYVDRETVTERWSVVNGALRRLRFDHFDRDALNSELEPATDDGDVRARIDPVWRQSDSGESVLLFDDSGRVYDCDPALDRTLRPLEVVALDSGLVSWATLASDDGLTGTAWNTAYWLARTVYGAPLPAWDGRAPRHTVVLPDADDLPDAAEVDAADRLQGARDAVADLYDDAATTPGADVLRVLPALGKTHQVAHQASDHPVFYGAPRAELMKGMLDRCRDAGVSAYALPTFGEVAPPDHVVDAGARAVREEGQQLLRDRAALVDETEDRLDDGATVPHPGDLGDDDSADLPRESCETADGVHGPEWWLAVHVARERGHRPERLHSDGTTLFGDPLPCACDECVDPADDHDHDAHRDTLCAYSRAWEHAADPDHPFDVLIGHYTLAHVPTARSYIARDSDGEVVREPRTVALDEFVGDAFHESFGDEWRDAAVWAGGLLDSGVVDFADLTERGLWSDDAVRGWIDGEPPDSLAELADTLAMLRECLARPAAVARDTLNSSARPARTDAVDTLEHVADLGLPSPRRLETVYRAVARLDDDDRDRRADDEIDDMAQSLATLRHRLRDAGVDSVAELVDSRLAAARDHLAGDLANVVDDAVRSLATGDADTAVATLDTASRAVRGGRDGVEQVALWSDDGDSHPLAHTLLAAAAAPRDADASTVVECDAFGWGGDGDGPTRVQRVAVGNRDTVLADRDGHGATVSHPPAFDGADGGDCPVVGLDATARRRLWSLALGTEVDVRDVHDDMAERREFVRDVFGMSVIQTTDDALYYEGDPSSIDLDGPTELLREISERHGTDPGVITTKSVETRLQGRDDAVAEEWAHYGDLTGSERLVGHDVAALLGCQHWGDAVVERWAALAGEEVHRTGHGTGLSYGSGVADDALGLMRDDQVLQALLRFGRSAGSDVTVYAHTGCLRDDVPVVDRGEVVRTYSETAQTVAETAADLTGRWTRSDLQRRLEARDDADDLATSDSRLRGILRDLRDRGYIETVDESPGRATVYGDASNSGAGEVTLPDTDTDDEPPEDHSQYTYTWSHRVADGTRPANGVTAARGATIPSPDDSTAVAEGDPPPS